MAFNLNAAVPIVPIERRDYAEAGGFDAGKRREIFGELFIEEFCAICFVTVECRVNSE